MSWRVKDFEMFSSLINAIIQHTVCMFTYLDRPNPLVSIHLGSAQLGSRKTAIVAPPLGIGDDLERFQGLDRSLSPLYSFLMRNA